MIFDSVSYDLVGSHDCLVVKEFTLLESLIHGLFQDLEAGVQKFRKPVSQRELEN